MALIPIALLQLGIGAGWLVLGAANVLVLVLTDAEPVYGWWFGAAVGIGVALATAFATARQIRRSLADATPAAGIPLGSPAEAIGRSIGPVAIAMAMLLALALLPGAEPYQGLAACMFAAVGAAYGPLALWVRRFEQMQGVVVANPVNRWGIRVGPVRSLRLPR